MIKLWGLKQTTPPPILRTESLSAAQASAREPLAAWRHAGLMADLFSLLRSRLPEDSPLLPLIEDIALLMQATDGNSAVPADEDFDLRVLLEQARGTARRIYPPAGGVLVTVSLAGGLPVHWHGKAAYVEMLLRHLILLSMTRLQAGWMCLRLESTPELGFRFMLEDSGPPLSRQQTLRLLEQQRSAGDGVVALSWHVAGAMLTLLKAKLDQPADVQGLALSGTVPLEPAIAPLSAPAAAVADSAMTNDFVSLRPLILLAEDDHAARYWQSSMLQQMGCDVFAVPNGQSAMEWATVLPLAAVMLDGVLQDMPGHQVAAWLQTVMSDGTVPPVPVWALTASEDTRQWRQAGVQAVMLKPLRAERIRALIAGLKAASSTPFFARNTMIAEDAPQSLGAALPALQHELAAQVMKLGGELVAWRPGEKSAPVAAQAHALKSAALVLGYQRLGALGGVIEGAINHRGNNIVPENKDVLAAWVHHLGCSFAVLTQPLPDEGCAYKDIFL